MGARRRRVSPAKTRATRYYEYFILVSPDERALSLSSRALKNVPFARFSFLNLHGNLLEHVPPPVVWAEMKRLKTLYIGGNRLPLPDHLNVHTTPQAF